MVSDIVRGVKAWQLYSLQNSRLPVTVALVTLWIMALIVLVVTGSTLLQLPRTHGVNGTSSLAAQTRPTHPVLLPEVRRCFGLAGDFVT